jgi:hypothetical protein
MSRVVLRLCIDGLLSGDVFHESSLVPREVIMMVVGAVVEVVDCFEWITMSDIHPAYI